MLSNEDFYARLAEEARILEVEEPGFKPVKNDLTHWIGFILGTGTYEGGVFQIEIKVSRKFPFEAPNFWWKTKIFHPNIINEKICIGVFNKDWVPTMTISGLIEAVRVLLNYPNPKSPLNHKAAKLLLEDESKFKATVRDFIEKFATWDHLSD